MHFKLEKIIAPAFDGDMYFVDLAITFDHPLGGNPIPDFASICVGLPCKDVLNLVIAQIEVLAIAAARRQLR